MIFNIQSNWNSFFEENDLKKILNLDINRTYQDKELFQSTQIKEMMVNILFIWSKENKDVSYKQGMNEILAVILCCFYPFYFVNTNKNSLSTDKLIELSKSDPESYYKEIYLFMHDEEEIASDLYYAFDCIMNKGIKDLFDTKQEKKKESYKKFELFQQQWAEEEEPIGIVKLYFLNNRINFLCKEDVS